jgi:hypothetical protein
LTDFFKDIFNDGNSETEEEDNKIIEVIEATKRLETGGRTMYEEKTELNVKDIGRSDL